MVQQDTGITTYPTRGKEADSDKVRFELLIPEFIEAFARVMMFGAKKYGDWNYLLLQRERVIGAVHRHINAYQQGEHNDAETGESHLIHATCCMMMLWGIDNEFHGKKERLDADRKYDPSITENSKFILSVDPVCNNPKVNIYTKNNSSAGVAQNISTDINTENVKVKGDLVALRWMGSNLAQLKEHCPLSLAVSHSGSLIIDDSQCVIYIGDWLIINNGAYHSVLDSTFKNLYKHLFE